MTPPQDLVDQLLMKNSANRTMSALQKAGYTPTFMHITDRLSTLIAEGKREPIPHAQRGDIDFTCTEIRKGASLEGSEKLLEACLGLYAKKANRTGLTIEEAMLTTLYAPADVVAWRAAA